MKNKRTISRITTLMLTALLFAGNVLPCAFPSYAETEVIETVAAAEAGESENQAAQENSEEAETPEAASEEKTDNAEASTEQPVTAAETASEAVTESAAESEGQAETEGAAGEAQPEEQEAAESTETAETVAESEETTEVAEGSETTTEAETQETAAEEAAEESVNTEASEPASELASPSNAEYGQEEVAEAPAEEEGKKVYTETVDGVTVTVTADAGVFPEGAELHVEKVEKEEDEELDAQLEKALSKKRKAGRKQSGSIVFDIKMLADGEEVQPDNEKGEVYVTFTMEDALNSIDKADIYHIHEEEKNESTVMMAEKLKVLTEEESEKLLESGEETESEQEESVPSDGMINNDLGEESVEENDESRENEQTGLLNLSAKTDGFSYYIVEFSYEPLSYEIKIEKMLCNDEEVNRVSIFDIMWSLIPDFVSDDCLLPALDEPGGPEYMAGYLAELDETEGLTLEKEGCRLDETYIRIEKAFAGTGTLKLTIKKGDLEKTYKIDITCAEVQVPEDYVMSYSPSTEDYVENLPETERGLKEGDPYKVSEQIPERAGYEFIDWTLYWKEYYTVYYLEKGTEFILDSKVVTGVEADKEYEETALYFDDHTLAGASKQSITVNPDGDNVLKFYYTRDYKVIYVVNPDPIYGTPPEGSEAPKGPTMYAPGENVDVADQLNTAVDYAYNKIGEMVKGTWEFVTWDKADFEIYMDTTITGGWVFTPKKYKYIVHYKLYEGHIDDAKTVHDDTEGTVDALGDKVYIDAIPVKKLYGPYRNKTQIYPGYQHLDVTIKHDNFEITIWYLPKGGTG